MNFFFSSQILSFRFDKKSLKRCLLANHPSWRGALDGDIEWTETCYKREVMLGELAFEGQFSFGCFYA